MTLHRLMRVLVACVLMSALLAVSGWKAGYAQISTDAPTVGPPDAVVADQAATYSAVAAPTLLAALDRAQRDSIRSLVSRPRTRSRR